MWSSKAYRAKVPLWVRGILASPFVILLIACLYFTYWMLRLDAALEEKREAIRAAGYPVTLAELDGWYPDVPDTENAANIYRKAFRRLQEVDEGLKGLKALVGPNGPEHELIENRMPDDEGVGDYLASASQALADLQEAGQYSTARFPLNFSMGISMELSHLPELRSLAQLAALSSQQALAENDDGQAVSWIETVIQIGMALEKEPILISQLVRLRINAIGVDQLEELLNGLELPQKQLDLLMQCFNDAESPEGFRSAFVGERCMSTEMVRGLYDEDSKTMDRAILEGRARVLEKADDRVVILFKWQELRCYSFFDALIRDEGPDWPGMVSTSPPAGSWVPERYRFVDILHPALYRARDALVKDIARLRIAQAALAIEQFRVERDALPNNISECVPAYLDAVPQDPFDGQPIRYVAQDDGYRVYSVSRDLGDDRGAVQDEWKRGEVVDGDLVFAVTR